MIEKTCSVRMSVSVCVRVQDPSWKLVVSKSVVRFTELAILRKWRRRRYVKLVSIFSTDVFTNFKLGSSRASVANIPNAALATIWLLQLLAPISLIYWWLIHNWLVAWHTNSLPLAVSS